MISYIKGKLQEIRNNSAVIESAGIGYEILCPLNDLAKLSIKQEQEVIIYTHLVHKEDNMTLYGFISEKNKRGFLNLIKVDGIGPKAAVKILSHYEIDALYDSIEREDVDSLKAIPGIGPKTAKQIIFDLKGVIPKPDEKTDFSSRVESDLISGLTNLGYRELDIRNALKELKPLSDNFETEFKRLLKKLAGTK